MSFFHPAKFWMVVQVKYVIAGLLHTVFFLCSLLFILSLAQKIVVNKLFSAPLAAQWLQMCSGSVDEYFLSSNFQYNEIVEYDCWIPCAGQAILSGVQLFMKAGTLTGVRIERWNNYLHLLWNKLSADHGKQPLLTDQWKGAFQTGAEKGLFLLFSVLQSGRGSKCSFSMVTQQMLRVLVAWTRLAFEREREVCCHGLNGACRNAWSNQIVFQSYHIFWLWVPQFDKWRLWLGDHVP